jgi:hypothetical protein
LAVVSSDSGNCTDEILLTGLLAGVPWRGEEQGDERGEILARAPGRFCFLAFMWFAEETV